MSGCEVLEEVTKRGSEEARRRRGEAARQRGSESKKEETCREWKQVSSISFRHARIACARNRIRESRPPHRPISMATMNDGSKV